MFTLCDRNRSHNVNSYEKNLLDLFKRDDSNQHRLRNKKYRIGFKKINVKAIFFEVSTGFRKNHIA